MRDFKYLWVLGLLLTAAIILVPVILFTFDPPAAQADPWANVPDRSVPHTDHTALMPGPYETGSDVTRACLSCHEEAAQQVMATSHWTWLGDPVVLPGRDEPVRIGKENLLNNFCLSTRSNEDRCMTCHIGYGWTDRTFDFSNAENIDCLACHDRSGGYVKGESGFVAEGVDLTWAAGSVGLPTRQNCGACHFDGGGGNGVKHGDLDESLLYPPESVDVHMGRYDFVCTDCHQGQDHQMRGRSISVSVETSNQVQCTDCHDAAPHNDDRLNEHTDTVACQTCHIPATALRDPTKVSWDWSQAGDPNREENIHEYLRIKGEFVYENDYTPEYMWYNGTASRYLVGDPMNPNEITHINYPMGAISDPDARIWPFKVHLGNQPYDAIYNILLTPHTVGEQGYWTIFDWPTALTIGAEANGIPFSGEYGFAPTDMYWTQSHMVVPAENALSCTDCHGENGRLDWQALGYPGDPMTWGGRGS
jgi:octaheme c-type cytochrome (tetrathionate reductase family)